MKEWAVTAENNVIPLNDLREHIEGERCWRKPWYEGYILVHNSADRREVSERRPS
jgi:hypothetical protein